jgi:3'(2'), 5'-bisphosphate nucleotidase
MGGGTGRFWTVDPIDGTKGFLRGEQYAVALALIDAGQVVLGVLGCPNLPCPGLSVPGPAGCLVIAERGRGAQLLSMSGEFSSTACVADTRDPAEAVFCESVESAHTAHGDAARVAAAMGVRTAPVRMDSQCKYTAVARGDASIYLRLPTSSAYREKIWDHAAGALIVEEAGGQVTDVTGRALDFSLGRTLQGNLGVVATNRCLHDPVMAAIRDAGLS